MRSPKVSVVIPAYNHERYVREAIQSVLDQTYRDFELIVINDGSTDNTEAEILKFKDDRVLYLSQENRGLSATLNRGIGLARGEYFNFLPSDDAFLPEKLEVQLRKFEDSGDIGVVFSYQSIVDREGREVKDDPVVDWFAVPFETKEEIFPALFERDFLSAPTALIKMDCFKRVGEFDESLKTAQDYDLWMRILKYFDLGLVKRPLLKMRWHGANLTYKATPETELERAKVLLKAYKTLRIEDVFPSLHRGKGPSAYAEAYEKLAAFTERSGLSALVPISQIFREKGQSLIKPGAKFPESVEKEAGAGLEIARDENIHLLMEVSSLDRGGMEEVIFSMATHLDPGVFRTVVVCVERGGYMESQLRKAGISVEVLGQQKEQEYLEILRRYRIDLVITHFSNFGPPLAFRGGIPVICFIHSIYNWVSNRLFDDFRRVDLYVSKYIAVSKQAARYAQYRFNIGQERIQVIPNSIDLKRFEYRGGGPVTTRQDLGWKEEDFVFLHVGAISRTKMHNLMVAALRSLPATFSLVKILCLGQVLQEDYYEYIQKRIHEEGLEERMKLIGFKEDPQPYYQLADAFLLPSLIEGWGLATLEAMYHGLPLILTPVGGAEEFVENGDIGILINNCYKDITDLDDSSLDYFARQDSPGNTGELAEAMADFFKRRESWREAGKKGREKVVSRYLVDRVMPQYGREFLRVAIEGKNRREGKLIYRDAVQRDMLKQQAILYEIRNRMTDVDHQLQQKMGFLEYQLQYMLRRLSLKERIKERTEKIRQAIRLWKLRKSFVERGKRGAIDQKESNEAERPQEAGNAHQIPPGALVGNKYDIFFFPMIDFSFRYQRPQQLASYFGKRGHRVFYLNTTQWMPLDARETFKIKCIKENVFEVFLKCNATLDIYGGEIQTESLEVLYSSLDSLRREWGLTTTVSLVHNPFWAPLALKMKEEWSWKIIYDCMDEWDNFSGVRENFLRQEAKLAEEADLLTVTADLLYEKWHRVNPTCTVVRNACDYEHFLKASSSSLLSNIRRPIIGFFGGIADWVDVESIHHAASLRENWSFVLLGGVFTDTSLLHQLKNVHLLGNQPYPLIPNYLYQIDVCLIPFKKNKTTDAVNPVKLYEYFSLGKPVVAREIHELVPYGNYLYLYNTGDELVACIEKALGEKNPELAEQRKKIAAGNTWEERTSRIDQSIRKTYKKVSVIIVTYNNLNYTKLCLESILSKTDYPCFEILIVDNHSTDGTPDYLRGLAREFDFIKLILNEQNLGFGKANNQAVNICEGDDIVFLNNDVVVTKGWLSKFVYYLEKFPEIGLIGPVTNFCGNEAKIETTYGNLQEMDQFAYSYCRAHEGKLSDIRMLALYCAAVRKKMIQRVGSLDERFEVGMFEDDDYSYRVRLAGYRVVCAEDIFIHHFGMGAFNKLLRTGEYDTIFENNKRLFEEKWGITWEPHRQRRKRTESIR